MGLVNTITNLLTGLTENQIRAISRADQQLLSDQLRRVYRIIEGDRIVSEAQEATAPKSGVLHELKRQPAEWR
jgi:hypothetical protein